MVLVLGKANIFFTSFKVWSWVDNIFTFSVHQVTTEHDGLGRFSHTFSSGHITKSFFRSFKALIVGLPRIGKKSHRFHQGSISSGQVIGLIVVEYAAETAGLTDQSFVDFDEDGFIAVPFQSPGVSDFFDNQVISNSGNVHTEKVGWNGNKVSFKSSYNWLSVFVFA